MNKRSVRDLDVGDKRVLVRVDFNVPVKDGEVTDDTRIRRALPTIRYLFEEGARPILISHLGRPKGEPDPKYADGPVAARLEELLGEPVEKLDAAVGPEVEEAIDDWDGKGVVLLENSRFYPGETKNDPDSQTSSRPSPTSTWTTRSARPTGRTPRPSGWPRGYPPPRGS